MKSFREFRHQIVERLEELDELSARTLASYTDKARKQTFSGEKRRTKGLKAASAKMDAKMRESADVLRYTQRDVLEFCEKYGISESYFYEGLEDEHSEVHSKFRAHIKNVRDKKARKKFKKEFDTHNKRFDKSYQRDDGQEYDHLDSMHDVAHRVRQHTKNQFKTKTNEDTQLDELSKKTLGNYVRKASSDASQAAFDYGDTGKIGNTGRRMTKRFKGIDRAVKRLAKEDTQLDELSPNTLGRYAKKALNHADLGHSSGAEDLGNRRTKGAKLAVKKLGKKAGDKAGATRTANNIQKSSDKAKAWRSDRSVDRNKEYGAAERGINKLWDKAASRRGK